MNKVIEFPFDRVRGHRRRRCADCGEWLEPQSRAQRCAECETTRIAFLRKHLWAYIEHRLLNSPA